MKKDGQEKEVIMIMMIIKNQKEDINYNDYSFIFFLEKIKIKIIEHFNIQF